MLGTLARLPRRMLLTFSMLMVAHCVKALGQTESVLVHFTGTTGVAQGAEPRGQNLVQASDGNFYGVTASGGSANCGGIGCGTVFKMTPSGILTTLHLFSSSPTDGTYPEGGLIQGTDGNLYGTTSEGGANTCGPQTCGAIFKISSSGTFTLLHSFSGPDGEESEAGLVEGADGNIYGTADGGGALGYGTVYQITPSGTFTLLHTFSGTDGAAPLQGSLVRGADGNLYGTTFTGGAYGLGTVFEVTPGGVFTLIYSFSGGTSNGNGPSGLLQGSDGNFYGTTQNGGAFNEGILFRVSYTGTFTLIHSFSQATTDGFNAQGSNLIQGSDGNIYGTTDQGGTNGSFGGFGIIYSITPSGVFTQLYSFKGATADGSFSVNGLTQGTDGSYYGLCSQGGANGFGTIFKFVPSSAGLTAPVVSVSAVNTNYGSTAPVTVTATETGAVEP
jgi:uncharacterized repeat protein (TIGR03803 family)